MLFHASTKSRDVPARELPSVNYPLLSLFMRYSLVNCILYVFGIILKQNLFQNLKNEETCFS